MLRNQTLSTDLESSSRYHHQSSPRKSKQYQYTGVFQPSLLYRSKYASAEGTSPEHQWIGKTLVPWNGESLDPFIWQRRTRFIPDFDKLYVSEYDIAVRAQPYIYRIIYIKYDARGQIHFISRPEVQVRSGRLNVLVTQDNVIRDVAYF